MAVKKGKYNKIVGFAEAPKHKILKSLIKGVVPKKLGRPRLVKVVDKGKKKTRGVPEVLKAIKTSKVKFGKFGRFKS